MSDEKPLEEAVKAAAQELVRQIYPDTKAWLTSIGKMRLRLVDKEKPTG